MKKPIGLLAVLMLASYALLAQESNCSDGKDNDGDGFIDCYDSDCAADKNCIGGFVVKVAQCESKPDSVPKFSMTLSYGSPNQVSDHLSRISIGDIDRDGIPEIVTLNAETDILYILSGKDGTIKKSLKPGYDLQREVIIGNINNDNCAEIFVYAIISNKHYIVAYDCGFNELWRTQIRGNVNGDQGDPVHIGLADFDGDGLVELYAKDMILDAHQGGIIVNSSTDWRYVNGGPVAVDMDGNPGLELVIGCTIYNVALGSRAAGAGSLTVYKSNSNYKTRTSPTVIYYHTTSIADYNLDGFLDVIATGSYQTSDNTSAFFWDVHNNNLIVYNDYNSASVTIQGCNGSTGSFYAKGWQWGMGRINIGDIDGDGKMNATFISGKYLYALDENFNKLWRKDVKEETSGYTGCTLFDFNGDGSAEVVYRDEHYIYIINGFDGSTNTQQTCISRTNREYPIVADVNADGATELCVTCGFDDASAQANFCNTSYFQYGQVRVFKSAAQPWVPARKLWNQHGYFVVNVNDDLTIPKVQQNTDAIFSNGICTNGANRPLNSFLNQAPFINSKGCPTYAAPHLSFVSNSEVITPPTCPDLDFTVSFKITNQGSASVITDLPITFYNGDPYAPGSVKLNTVVVKFASALKPNDTLTVSNLTVTGPGTAFTLYGSMNDAGTTPLPLSPGANLNPSILECTYDPPFSATVNPLPFSITAEKLADDMKCSPSSPDNGAVGAYRLVNGSKVTAPYTFYWYNSGLPVSGAPNYTGAVYSNIPNGNYSVYAKSNAFQCKSDTVTVSVNLINNAAPVVSFKVLSQYTNCKDPNGAVRAIVNNGTDTTNYSFAWYEGQNFLSSIQIGVNATATHLKNDTYTVLVTSNITGCQGINSIPMGDSTKAITIHTSTVNAICSTSNSGSASADVGGNTSNYTFNWYKGSNVKPTPDFVGSTYSNLASGSYTVVATDNVLQCSSSPPTTLTINQTPAITVTATKISDQTSCDFSKLNGAASANVGGTTSGYTFAWYSGQDTLKANKIAAVSSVSGLGQGIYTVQATDNSTGCKDTDEVTINSSVVKPTLSATTVDVTHCTPYDGKITASVSTGVLTDYTFSWYNGPSTKLSPDYPDTDNILDQLMPGVYTLSAINTKTNCQADAITATIIDKSPAISFSLVNSLTVFPSDCTNPTGSLGVAVNAPGNTLGYDVQWFSGRAPFSSPAILTQTIPSVPGRTLLQNIATGVYSVTATDKNSGCSATQPFDLPFANSHKLTYVSQNDVTNCVPGNNGNVTVHLVPSSPNTVFNEGDYDINVYSGTNASGSPIQVIHGVAGQSDYTSSVPMAPGFYTFEAICTGPSGNNLVGCKSVPFAEQILQNTTNPVISSAAQNANTNCSGANPPNGTISLTVDGGASPLNYSFIWYAGATTSSPVWPTTGGANHEIAQNLKAGNYTVLVTSNATGCPTTQTFLELDNVPTISLANADLTTTPQTLCNVANGSAMVNSVSEDGTSVPIANYSFQWFDASMNPLPTNTNPENNLGAGNYFVKASNTVNNCSTSSPVQFAISDQTIGTVSVALTNYVNPTECLQPYPQNLGSLTTSASGTSVTGYTYNWYLGSSASGSVQSNSATISGITVVTPATEAVYTVEVLNNSNNCSTTDTYHLPLNIVPVILDATASPLTFCSPLNGTVYAFIVNPDSTDHVNNYSSNYTFTWYAGSTASGTPIYTGPPAQVPGLDQGQYTVVAVDNVDAACSATQTVSIKDGRVFTAPVAVQIFPVTNCDQAKPNGVASVSVDNAGVKDSINYTFDWYIGRNTSGAPIYTGAEITALTDTLYTVIATSRVTNCPTDTTIQITNSATVVPQPTITVISNVTNCITKNGAISASINGDTKDYIFYWYLGSSEKPLPDYVGDTWAPTNPGLDIGFYTVKAQSRITGCFSPTNTGEIKTDLIYPKIDVKTSGSSCDLKDQQGQPYGNGRAEVIVSNDVSIDNIVWSIGTPPVTGPVLDTLSAGIYSVKVTTTQGCSDSVRFEIKSDVHPYNGISRNGDNLNETFRIGCIEMFPNNNVKIFNRAGTLVYEDKGYDNTTVYFDGHSNKGVSPLGTYLPDGTYFFLIDRGDGEKPLAGYLEIVK